MIKRLEVDRENGFPELGVLASKIVAQLDVQSVIDQHNLVLATPTVRMLANQHVSRQNMSAILQLFCPRDLDETTYDGCPSACTKPC